jgi:GTP cyclohydrolase II
MLQIIATTFLPTDDGRFRVTAFRDSDGGMDQIALSTERIGPGALVRVHSECLTGDALGSLRCDCGAQLQESRRRILQSGNGILLYIRGHEGRGIGLGNKLMAYALQDSGMDTVEANMHLGMPVDARDYKIVADMLVLLGIKEINILTNNPNKIDQLERAGITILSRQPIKVGETGYNRGYLEAKAAKMKHL